MTGFHEVRFPDNIAYGATGGPEFATTVVVTGAGYEQRNVDWAEARSRWDVASGLKNQAQLDELIAFFRARKGKAYGFRFKDWADYKAVGRLLGTGDGVESVDRGHLADEMGAAGGEQERCDVDDFSALEEPVRGDCASRGVGQGLARPRRCGVAQVLGAIAFQAAARLPPVGVGARRR
jgi:uncharacterized protein (TIGR02217 family)